MKKVCIIKMTRWKRPAWEWVADDDACWFSKGIWSQNKCHCSDAQLLNVELIQMAEFLWQNFRGMSEYKKSFLFIYSNYLNIHKHILCHSKISWKRHLREFWSKFALGCSPYACCFVEYVKCTHAYFFWRFGGWVFYTIESLDFCFHFIWHSNKMVCFCLEK